MLQQFKSIHYILVFEIQMCVCVFPDCWGMREVRRKSFNKNSCELQISKKTKSLCLFFCWFVCHTIRNQNICYNKFSKWMDRYFAAYAHRMHIKDGPSCLYISISLWSTTTTWAFYFHLSFFEIWHDEHRADITNKLMTQHMIWLIWLIWLIVNQNVSKPHRINIKQCYLPWHNWPMTGKQMRLFLRRILI